MDKISIVVPVCNVEKYVEQCVRSIMNQTYRNLEIICINDGSTDCSLQILRKLASEDDRIVVVDKQNTGYGDTINTGFRTANGKYIGIVESDDFIEPDMYEKLYAAAEKYQADVVKSNFYEYYGDNNRIFNEYLQAMEYDCLVENNHQLWLLGPTIWTGLYNRQFLIDNDIYLLDTAGASYQDTSFAFKVMFSAKRTTFLKDAFVNYRCVNENASVKSAKKIFYISEEMEEEKRYLLDREHTKEDMAMLSRVKYLRYKWNLDRLHGVGKMKFLLKMFQEFRQDDLDGYLLREQWSEEDWTFIHRLIYGYDQVFLELINNEPVFCNYLKKTQLTNDIIFRMIEDVSVYGAGVRAKRTIERLTEQGVKVKRCVVSDGEMAESLFHGIKVEELSKASGIEDDIIILGISDKYREQVVESLRMKHLSNYFDLKD